MATGKLSVFTPQMAAAGIQLVPSGTTDNLKPLSAQLYGEAPRNRAINAPIPATPLPFDRNQAQPLPVTPKGIISPDDVRPTNPFNPTLRVAPEDDSLTPEGTLAPSEISSLGKALTGFGSSLSTPGFAKALGVLGASIAGPNSVGSGLGQLAVQEAESRARSQFEQRLNAGENAADILIPGLSPEGRETVLARRAEQGKEERIAGQEEQRLAQGEKRLRLQEIEQNNLQMARTIEQDLSSGRLDLQKATELRLKNQQTYDQQQREFKNNLDEQIFEVDKAYKEGLIRLRENPSADPSNVLDSVLRFNQTAQLFGSSLEDEQFALDSARSYVETIKKKGPALGGLFSKQATIDSYNLELKAAEDAVTAQEARVKTLQDSIDMLRKRSRDALIGLGAGQTGEGTPLASPANQGVVPTETDSASSVGPTAPPNSFSSTAAARAAGKKSGDIVPIFANGEIHYIKLN